MTTAVRVGTAGWSGSPARVREQKEPWRRFVGEAAAQLIRNDEPIPLGPLEKREAAILFSDMRGFTQLMEELPAETAFSMLNRSFALQLAAIQHYGGEVDKLLGDGVLASFQGNGYIDRAFRAALRIRDLVRSMEPVGDEPVLPVGLAVNAGSVIFGVLGTEDRSEHTAIGDVVNVSARLCGHARPFQIIVPERVARQVTDPGEFEFLSLEPLHLKGKSCPVRVLELVDRNRP